MVRRRQRTARGIKEGVLRKFTVLSVIGVTLALGYLWQHAQLIRIGYEIRLKEKRVSLLKKENQCLRLKICQLKSPNNIEKMIARKDLNLTFTKNWQYVYVRTPDAAAKDIRPVVTPVKKFVAVKNEKKVSLAKPKAKNATL